jgi:tetratricopeptide (TPR) repeat protein
MACYYQAVSGTTSPKEFRVALRVQGKLSATTPIFQCSAIKPKMVVRSRFVWLLAFALIFVLVGHAAALRASAQSAGGDIETEADPIRLFEQGQDHHARGRLTEALAFYEQAIRLRPEFPEAEYQRATALLSLNRATEAEAGLRRAIALRSDWTLPQVALALLLARDARRDTEARPTLERALALDANNINVIAALGAVLMRAGDAARALELLRRATSNESTDASLWALRAATERASGDSSAALSSLDRALTIRPGDLALRLERAELRLAANERERAIEDLRVAENVWSRESVKNPQTTLRLASLYARAGDNAVALRMLDALDERSRASSEAIALRSEITNTNAAETPESLATLEQTLQREPRNAALLARLGAAYRTTDPQRSLEFYRRAAEIEPGNADYATGFASALVQARRFEQAVTILRRVIAAAPDTYAAHSNLAIALDAMGRHAEALIEYQWISRARPDLAITHYFIGRSHDLLGQLPEALAAYETFLARADAAQNQLEIERVNLRLPPLRNQIRRQGGNRRRRTE